MNIDKASSDFITQLEKIKDSDSLENLRIKYLGRKGLINSFIEELKKIDIQNKKILGPKINALKQNIESQIAIKSKNIIDKNEKEEFIDITLPGKKYPKGTLHPTTLVIEEIEKIFKKIGFNRSFYPEVEWEHFAFDALNMPKNHPARDDFETFFISEPENKKNGKMILTPHTSSGQNREMQRLQKPPIRMVNIGKCYRPNWDTTHTPMLHQFEGMCIDKNINISNLKGTIEYFVHEFFSTSTKIRLRPFHFQFTEPSFEIDITCEICKGTGIIHDTPNKESKCKVCKSGWLELGGSGMIHPNVLIQGGTNPEEYSGWAFGFGVERVSMMKKEFMLDDIRILYSGQLEFLNQF
ncbi:MAG: phenylalanine--tRNA ligase subunit alpha [bacterium]